MTDKQPDPAKKVGQFTGWMQELLTPLVDEAVDRMYEDIKTDLTDMKNDLVGQITQLPGLIASQIGTVAVDAERVAELVAQQFGKFLNPDDIAKQIEQGILGGLPHFPGIPGFGFAGTAAGAGGAGPGTFGTAGVAAGHEFKQPDPASQISQDDAGYNKPAPESEKKAPRRKTKASEIRERLDEKKGDSDEGK